MTRSTRFAVCLGLLAGSLAIASHTQPASAEIPVSGGQARGEAAFFIPGTNASLDNTVLFDATVRQLRIETPENGTTTNSIFIPTAGRLDPVGKRAPKAGDTGTLRGNLSGIAFTRTGSPVFFQSVPTQVDFTLDSFDAFIDDIDGTLITAKDSDSTAPLLFLPVRAQLDSESRQNFEANLGELTIGSYEATLDDGSIALPSTLKFQTDGSLPEQPIFIGSRTKFELRGEGRLISQSGGATGSTDDDAAVEAGDDTTAAGDDTTASTDTTTTSTDTTTTATGTDTTTSTDTTSTSTDTDTTATGTDATTTSTDSTTTATGTDATTTSTGSESSETTTTAERKVDFNPLDGDIAYASDDANVTKFKIQSIGSRGSREFSIKGEVEEASVDIYLDGIEKATLRTEGDLTDDAVEFDVKGQGIGVTSFVRTSDDDPSISYVSNDSRTNFKFAQRESGFKLEGKSRGETRFNIGLVESSFGSYTPSSSSSNTQFDSSTYVSNRNFDDDSSFDSDFNAGTSGSTNNAVNVVVRGGSSSTTSVTNGTIIAVNSAEILRNNVTFVTGSRTVYINAFTLESLSTQGMVYTFQSRGGATRLYRASSGRGRGLALGRRSRGQIVAYKVVGASSRLFPGLVGLQQLSDSEIEELNIQEITGFTGLQQLPADDDADDIGDDVDDNDDADDISDDDADDIGDDVDDADDDADDIGDDVDDADDDADDIGDDVDDADDDADDIGDDVDDADDGVEGLDDISDDGADDGIGDDDADDGADDGIGDDDADDGIDG